MPLHIHTHTPTYPKFVCARMNALMRLIVINLIIILKSMWARYSGNGCIYACAYKFRVGVCVCVCVCVYMRGHLACFRSPGGTAERFTAHI